MNVAAYYRVSTDDQKCDLQIAEIGRYAEARGWEIAGHYKDEGVSGKRASRPALDRLMDDAMSRRIDCVLVWKLDRFGRSVKNLSDLLAQLDAAGVRFIAITQAIDTDKTTSTSRFLLNILKAAAEFESDIIRERVLSGIKSYREDRAAGRPRVSKSGKNLDIGRPRRIWDRDEARRLREAGVSLRTIAETLGVSTMAIQRELSK